jgi:hypothetical protein
VEQQKLHPRSLRCARQRNRTKLLPARSWARHRQQLAVLVPTHTDLADLEPV